MSISSSLALQKALHATLSAALPLVSVHDHVPADAPLPFVAFGVTTVRDIGGVSAPLDEHVLAILVWSRAESRVVVAEMAATVREAAETHAIDVDGHRLINRLVEQVDISRDPATRLFRAQVRLRAVTEPIA